VYIVIYSVKKNIIFFVQSCWKKTNHNKAVRFLRVILFGFLCCCEKLYIFCFFIDQKRRRLYKKIAFDYCKVISVGNLSVGGTGKSVITAFLVKYFGADACAIVLRGYGRPDTRSKNLIVSDGVSIFCDVTEAGDESIMLAHSCKCPVAIGSNRKISCELLIRFLVKTPRYLILDDAYQNHQVKKDCEILLLDARMPFGNGHCLPAGLLREKDYSRADIIMLTHADCVSSCALQDIKKQLSCNFLPSNIISTRHVISNFLCGNNRTIEKELLFGKQFLVFAGIGSFDNFTKSILGCGMVICKTVEFADHHIYEIDDLVLIASLCKKYNCYGAVTTTKDWTKIEHIFKKKYAHLMQFFFVASVAIEFLSEQEYSQWSLLLEEKIRN
jgi:tetraacyldisaccharide 4'-kinase